jgi:OmpA-OmpF porin, OOP family
MNVLTVRPLRKSMFLGLLIFAAGIGSIVRAQDAGFYVGGNIGQSRATIDSDSITSNLQSQGSTVNSYSDDERDTGFKLFGGYQFSEYFALEGGYFNLGKFDFKAATTPPGTYDGEIKIDGLNVDAVLMFPVTEQISLFGRAGATDISAKDSFNSTGSVSVNDSSPSDSDANYKFGVGLQYAITRSFSFRAEAERYRVDDGVGDSGDVELFSFGLVYYFGAKAAPVKVASKQASAPERAPAPEPAPALRPELVIVPVATERYCSILDIEFDIDVDGLQRKDEEKLEALGTLMNKYKDTTAVTEAYGASRPIADNSIEKGKRRNRRINAVSACATDFEGLQAKPLDSRWHWKWNSTQAKRISGPSKVMTLTQWREL